MKKPTLYLVAIVLLAITMLCIVVNEARSAEKPDTTISVSVEKIQSQIAVKQEHLKQVQDEMARIDQYRAQLDKEATGTIYQLDAYQKLKAEADTTTTKRRK